MYLTKVDGPVCSWITDVHFPCPDIFSAFPFGKKSVLHPVPNCLNSHIKDDPFDLLASGDDGN